jgi:hypothetical protein
LHPAVGLGISNETTADTVEIRLTSGVLTVFVDDRLDREPS